MMSQPFSWDTIWSELQKYMPRLVSFLQEIIPEVFDGSHRRIIAMIISIILKYRNPKMCLVQKVVSVFLFGNSVHKKVIIIFLIFVKMIYCTSNCL